MMGRTIANSTQCEPLRSFDTSTNGRRRLAWGIEIAQLVN